uniref:Uncharacterized protein n=1 Tax=Romanomermis culicivorax TaxID=13658 RepID=A0A915IYW3_ROMCU
MQRSLLNFLKKPAPASSAPVAEEAEDENILPPTEYESDDAILSDLDDKVATSSIESPEEIEQGENLSHATIPK